jgi:Bacterial SH3 domain
MSVRLGRRHLFVVIVGVVVGLPTIAALTQITVMVKESRLRATPASYAKPVGTVSFGQKLDVQETKEDWYRVTVAGTTGWLHRSAVTTKKVDVGKTASVGSGRVSNDEVTLAGKGFNPQVEAEYRKRHPGSNFAAVDAMEKLKISEDEVRRFVEAPQKGGA